ncbi:MAG TPA: preprotein translocase subunit SecG [Prolixibacteraceae bacterium]|nr:preprotein translocase subunit SecG [Prolixibacteraceae bacterium]
MYSLITILLFIVCILLILIVLVQNSKGGGLASNFQASNQIMGVRKTTDFLEKATWGLAIALLVLSVGGSAFIPRENKVGGESAIKDQIENAIDPNQVPSFPAPDATTAAPATTTAPDSAK